MCLAVLAATPAGAAEKLRVSKAVPFAWTFTPLDVGIQTGIFAKHGLDVEASAAAGDAKLQQALAADSIDIGIGSGPGMAFMAKGVPAKAVAVMYGVPKNMAVMVAYNSPIKTVDDLKGKKLGCTTVGSLTYWIGDRITQSEGLGRRRHHHGADRRHAAGPRSDEDQPDRRLYRRAGDRLSLEEQKEWRVITSAAPFVEDFITHVFFARDELIQKKPDLVRAFLKGWMDTIAFMKANKDKTVEITSKVINVSPAVAARAYDEQIGTFSTDGTFDPKAVAALKKSFIEMGLLKEPPPDDVMFTTQFVPVK